MVNNMKYFRIKSNLTQEQVADKLGIAVSTYSMMENGKRGVDLQKAKSLEKIFNTTIDDIFFNRIFHSWQN